MLSLGGIKATLSFAVNKAYIIKELCVQKDEPVNTCQGQCHLHKTIKKQAEEDSNLSLAFEGQLAPFVVADLQNALSEYGGVEMALDFAPVSVAKIQSYSADCPHPPRSKA